MFFRKLCREMERHLAVWNAATAVLDRLEPGLQANTLTHAECDELGAAIRPQCIILM